MLGGEFGINSKMKNDKVIAWANIILAIAAIATFIVTWQSLQNQASDNHATLATLEKQASALQQQASSSENQVNALQRQVSLNSIEARPYVHTLIINSKSITPTSTLFLNFENSGQIPSSIIYSEEIAQLFDSKNNKPISNPMGGVHLGVDDPTALYPGASESGMSLSGPVLSNDIIQAIQLNMINLKIAICTIYKPLDNNDKRQWETDEVWSINSANFSLPLSRDLSTTARKCTAATLFSEIKY